MEDTFNKAIENTYKTFTEECRGTEDALSPEEYREGILSAVETLDANIQKRNAAPTKEGDFLGQVFSAMGANNSQLGGSEEFLALLGLPDEQFSLICPFILEEIEKSFNTAAARGEFAKMLIQSGETADDYVSVYLQILATIDEELQDTLSVVKRNFIKQLLGMVVNAISECEGAAKLVLEIPIEIVREGAVIPQYSRLGDAGMDLYSTEDYTIKPGETKLIPLGFKVAIPLGYALLIQPRSGLSLKTKLRVANTPGLIDSGYRDEVGVIVENLASPIEDITYTFDEETHNPVITSILHGADAFIGKGERFAQMRLVMAPTAAFYAVDSVANVEGDRGGGFGHTGS